MWAQKIPPKKNLKKPKKQLLVFLSFFWCILLCSRQLDSFDKLNRQRFWVASRWWLKSICHHDCTLKASSIQAEYHFTEGKCLVVIWHFFTRLIYVTTHRLLQHLCLSTPIDWGQFGVQYFAEGYFCMQTRGVQNQSPNLLIGRQPTLPPEPEHGIQVCFVLHF